MSIDITAWFAGVAMIAGAACGGGAQSKASTVEIPAAVGALPARLEDDYRVFAANCSKCHGLERAFSAPVTDHQHWERYVAKMMRTPSSGISSREAPNILAFLFWYTDRRAGRVPAEGEQPVAPAAAIPPELAPVVAPVEVPAPAPAPTPIVAPSAESTP